MKIVTVIGARPQFIKASAFSAALQIYNRTSSFRLNEVIVHTGQHYDVEMSEIFFQELNIPKPHYNLGVGSSSHGIQTAEMLSGIEKILLKEIPELILVYGDTNSTLAGALAASKLHMPVGHIEAGLRSYNRKMPEEINRVLTDHISDFLFAPTQNAADNLLREGIDSGKIHVTGDIMLDVALRITANSKLSDLTLFQEKTLPKSYILVTIHRAENTDSYERLHTIAEELSRIAKMKNVIMPLHPRTRVALANFGLLQRLESNVQIVKPVGFLEMAALEKNAAIIITDSGGIQKEAFFHRVPCITCRTETEWIELVELGVNQLTEPETLSDKVRQLLSASSEKLSWDTPVYGSGNAAAKIIRAII